MGLCTGCHRSRTRARPCSRSSVAGRPQSKAFPAYPQTKEWPHIANSTRSVGFRSTKTALESWGWRVEQASPFNRGDRGMIGGLKNHQPLFARGCEPYRHSGHWGSRGQSAKYARDSSADRSDAGHHQGAAKAGAGRQGASLRGQTTAEQRQRQRSRPQGQVEGRAGILERRWQSSSSRSAAASRPNTTTSIRIRRSRPSRTFSATELRRARLGVEGVVYYDCQIHPRGRLRQRRRGGQGRLSAIPGRQDRRQRRSTSAPAISRRRTRSSADQRAVRRYARACGLHQLPGNSIGRSASRSAIGTDHWGLAAGIFGERFTAANAPSPLFPGFTGDEDVTFAARGTVAPINRQVNGVNQVLHFGASVRTRDVGDDQPLFQYTQRGADFHLANNTINTR